MLPLKLKSDIPNLGGRCSTHRVGVDLKLGGDEADQPGYLCSDWGLKTHSTIVNDSQNVTPGTPDNVFPTVPKH